MKLNGELKVEQQRSAEIAAQVNRFQNVVSRVSGPVDGRPLSIRSGFEALSFKHEQFDDLMDPLVMVDHYTMTEPTFGAHAHAGMSAVTVLFEDSQGSFNNRDSLGNDIDLMPGDLYWLKAANGAVHDEKPVLGATAHGLQMFVNLPARLKHDSPDALHVKAGDMPQIESNGAKVRLVLGNSNGFSGASSPALPMTILDAKIDAGGHFEHDVTPGHSIWVHTVKEGIEVKIGGRTITVLAGQALAAEAMQEPVKLSLRANVDSQVVIVTGEPVAEAFVQRGPFVMSTEAEIVEVEAAYRSGRLGKLGN